MNQSTHPSRIRSSPVAAATGAPMTKIPVRDANKGKFAEQVCHHAELSAEEHVTVSMDDLLVVLCDCSASGSGVAH